MATTIFHVITGFVITGLGSGAAKRMLKRFPGAFAQLKYWRARLRRMLLTETTFIAVTGSCGKTLTTELTAAVLSVRGESCSQSGPNILRDSIHTLLTVAASSRFCVKEVSGDPPDEVSGHYRVLRPNIVIVTTICSDHYKTFRGPEMAAKVKGQLVENLPRMLLLFSTLTIRMCGPWQIEHARASLHSASLLMLISGLLSLRACGRIVWR